MKNLVSKLKPGSIIYIDFSPTEGHEQRGHRPALVLSNPNTTKPFNNMVYLAPITSSINDGIPYRVNIKCSKICGYVLLDHIRSLDLKARSFKYVETLDNETFKKCLKIAKILICNEE